MDNTFNIALLAGLLCFLLLYAFVIPKGTPRRFRPSSPGSASNNQALRFFSELESDIYAALPAGLIKNDKAKVGENQKIAALLRRAGNPWKITPQEFRSFQFIAAFIGFLIALPLAFLILQPMAGIPWYATVVAITIFSFFIPIIKHLEMAKDRDVRFRRELPEALDLMTISLAGGATFDKSLKDVLPIMKDGIVKSEFASMVKMLNSGSTTHQALEEFATRAPTDGVLTFVRSVQNALEVNAPMTEILQMRAEASRDEFFALVEQKAAQLESVMWASLVPTLLPALILIAIAPSVDTFMKVM